MKQLSWIQLILLCCLVVVAWMSMAASGLAESEAKSVVNSPESTNGVAEDAGSVDTGSVADPFEVPDGDADTLLVYISNLQKLPMPQGDREESIRFVTKIVVSASKAADKILTGDTTDEQAVMAVQFKFMMLDMAKQLSIEPVLATKDNFLKLVRNDKRPAIAELVKQALIKEQFGQWGSMNEDAKQKFMQDLEAYLQQSEIGNQQLALTMEIGEGLEYSDDTMFAAKLYQMAAPIFADSEQPQVVEYSKSFAGMARRLALVGNELKLSGSLLDGTSLDWSEYRGKVVLVDFWATWCGPCRAELPNLMKAYQQYHDKGFEVIGISLDSDREATAEFVEDQQLPWVTLFSDNAEQTGWQHPMAVYYGIQGIPTVILVGADGKVVSLAARGPELHKQLLTLLGEPKPLEIEKSGE